MTVVNPLSTANLFVQSTTAPAMTHEERQVDLRLEQMVRATVVEGGVDKALLEMNHRHYRAQSDVELQAGQKLTLQVLQTHPTLEFRVINDPLGGRLAQLLPLLSQPYDWSRLLDMLSQRSLPQNLPPSTAQVYQQLQQLLQPAGDLPAAVKNQLQQLPGQLQQLAIAVTSGQLPLEAPASLSPQQQPFLYYQAEKPVSLDLPQLLQGLQAKVAQLQVAEEVLPQAWVAETRNLVQPLQQAAVLTQGPLPLPVLLPQMSELLGVLTQLRQQPNLPPQLAGELERLVLQLRVHAGGEPAAAGRVSAQPASTAPPAVPTPPPAALAQNSVVGGPLSQTGESAPTSSAQPLSAATMTFQPLGVYRPSAAFSMPTQQPPAAPVVPTEISTALQQLLDQVQVAQKQTGKISPELFGRLEGLLDKLQQLPRSEATVPPLLPGMEIISEQLVQLIQQGPQLPEGGKLGLLSQLFGFHLEAELLKGKQKEALASLKTSLLAMQKELGEKGTEPLHRLELFQLCKARLADDQVQFLPLPFNELEEGYLLMEKAHQEAEVEGEPPLHVTLSLRLSALGNMRMDLLYDKQGLHLRMACEDKEKMTYLQQHKGELEESIVTVPLQGVSFAADAREPTRQLLEKLLPQALGLLDARI